MAEISIEHLSRKFEGQTRAALSDLSLSVTSGEFVVLVGPSGCGKSTALRIVAGLEDSDSGEVQIGGRSMRSVAPQDRDVAMVFQGYALYPHMRARDILSFPLKMRGASKQEQEKAVSETAQMLGITKLLDRRPGEMSGGERQRVAMGRALVRKPKVFLFDEPLSNLDASLRAEIRVEIGSLVRKLGATTLYVTHDHVEAMTLGDRICVLRDGMLEQIGSPREVYETPQTAFVATFLGSPAMNMTLARKEGEWLSCGPLRLRCDEATTPNEVLIGVRPEKIRIGSECPGDAVRAEATVLAVEPLGAETHLHLESGPVRLRARVPGFDAPARGDKVPIFFEISDLHAFETEGRQNRITLRLGAQGL